MTYARYNQLRKILHNSIENALSKHLKSNGMKEQFTKDCQKKMNSDFLRQTYRKHIQISSKIEFGDFQSNYALSNAKELKMQPRALASILRECIVEDMEVNDRDNGSIDKSVNDRNNETIFSDISVAGGGYINFTLSEGQLEYCIQQMSDKFNYTGEAVCRNNTVFDAEEIPQHVIVDYSSPNIAKEMHVGHLRSTIIGDALSNIYQHLGYKVTRINHVGDWGLPFGLLIGYMKHVVKHPLVHLVESEIEREYVGNMDTIDGSTSSNGSSLVSIDDLARLYKESKKLFDGDIDFQMLCRKEVRYLQHDSKQSISDEYQKQHEINMRLWKLICNASIQNYDSIYDLLNISKDLKVVGESSYHSQLRGLVDECMADGIAEMSQGAKCIFVPSELVALESGKKPKLKKKAKTGTFALGADVETNEEPPAAVPFLIEKSIENLENSNDAAYSSASNGGGFLYGTTDLAAIKYRVQTLKADKILYVTDGGQSLHFHTLFAIAKHKCHWVSTNPTSANRSMANGKDPVPRGTQLIHIPFGVMLGSDHKRIRSRTLGDGEHDVGSDSLKLKDLLHESIQKAHQELISRMNSRIHKSDGDKSVCSSASIDADTGLYGGVDMRETARVVGIAAVKYADLSSHRESDILFSMSKMLQFEGNTAPYLLYTYARAHNIRKSGADILHMPMQFKITSDSTRNSVDNATTTSYELALVKQLIHYEECLITIIDTDHCPHRLCTYLYQLSRLFNQFYEHCPVLKTKQQAQVADCPVERDQLMQLTYSRLILCHVTANTIKQALGLLGIDVVEKL